MKISNCFSFFRMNDSLLMQRDLSDLIHQILSVIPNVVVYKNEVILLKSWLGHLNQAINKLSFDGLSLDYEQKTAIESIVESLMLIQNDITMITEKFWINIALEWSVKKPTLDFFAETSKIKGNIEFLGGKINEYAPNNDDLIGDYHEIYMIFASLRIKKDETAAKMNSLIQFLNEKGLPLPEKVNEKDEKSKYFLQTFSEYKVDKQDFSIQRQIGFGASGTVYLALQISTKKRVAVKQLSSIDMSAPELDSLIREITVLSSLQHPYLIKFIGATMQPPYYIITEYMPGGSLFQKMKSDRKISPTQMTKILYCIAEGMAFLHSNNIIHRDLKSLNILIDSEDFPRICDFGISREVPKDFLMTGVVGTCNYMAPEVLKRTKYSFKADVFSFGLLIWEMLTKKVPFCGLDQLQIGTMIINGDRPLIPKTASNSLSRLIRDCWNQDPEARPTFSQILLKLTRWRICFPDSDSAAIEDFYRSKSIHESSSGSISKQDSLKSIKALPAIAPPDVIIMDLLDADHKSTIISTLLKDHVINTTNEEIRNKLRDTHFIEKVVPIMEKMDDPLTVATSLQYIINSNQLACDFINSGGIEHICHFLESFNSKELQKIGSGFVKHLKNVISDSDAPTLVRSLFLAKDYETVVIIMEKHSSVDFSSIIGAFLAQLIDRADNKKYKAWILGNFIIDHPVEDKIIEQMDCSFVLSMRSVEFAEKVVKNTRFISNIKEEDIIQICKTLGGSNKKYQKKPCAIVIATYLPRSIIQMLSQRPKFISDVISVGKPELIGKLLFKLCQFPEGSSIVLNHSKFLYENSAFPQIFSLFIMIGSYFPLKVIALGWPIQVLNDSIIKEKMIEPCLRVAGVLSTYPQFVSQAGDFIEKTLELINGDLNSLEMGLAIGVLCNVSLHCDTDGWLRKLLPISESNNFYSGLAMKILSKLDLPDNKSRQSGRIVDLVYKFIEGTDPHGIIGSCQFLIKMHDEKDYLNTIINSSLNQKLEKTMKDTINPLVFANIVEVFILYGFVASKETLNRFDHIMINPSIQGKTHLLLQDMKSKLKTKN